MANMYFFIPYCNDPTVIDNTVRVISEIRILVDCKTGIPIFRVWADFGNDNNLNDIEKICSLEVLDLPSAIEIQKCWAHFFKTLFENNIPEILSPTISIAFLKPYELQLGRNEFPRRITNVPTIKKYKQTKYDWNENNVKKYTLNDPYDTSPLYEPYDPYNVSYEWLP